MSARDVIEIIALLLVAGLVSELVAGILRVPRMLVLVGAGALLGPHAIGELDLPLDFVGVQILLTLGVSMILLRRARARVQRVASCRGRSRPPRRARGPAHSGGDRLGRRARVRPALRGGPAPGAVLAPTDPAILIPLFERMGLRAKVRQTVVASGALNDPTGAVLALAVAAFVLGEGNTLADPLWEFVADIAVSTGLGVAFGVLLALVISERRVGFWRESPGIAVLLVVTGATSRSTSPAGAALRPSSPG